MLLPYLIQPSYDSTSESIIRNILPVLLSDYLSNNDSVCCGNMGLVETLLLGNSYSEETKYLIHARNIGMDVAERYLDNQCNTVPGTHSNLLNPGFFQGASGVGYGLLRLIFPSELPSVFDHRKIPS